MGANSIDISQYRSRIGTFSRKKVACSKGQASLGNKLKTNGLMESFIVMSYLLVLSNVTQKLLIMSGVEINPGPFSLGKKFLVFVSTFVKILYTFLYRYEKKSSFSKYTYR